MSNKLINNSPTLFREELAAEEKIRLMHCICIIVEDAVDQMYILTGGRNSEQSLQKFYLSLEQRTAETLLVPIYDVETGDLYSAASSKRQNAKFLEDCDVCIEFLTTIRNELKSNKSFDGLKELMKMILNTKTAKLNLLKEETANCARMKHYKNMLITHSRDYQLEMQKENKILANYKDENQEILVRNLLRVRYINAWETSRQEQNILSSRKAEKELEDITVKYTADIEKEIRAHDEINLFITKSIEDMESKIKYWIGRYDQEKENLNIKIQIIKDQKEKLEKKSSNLKKLFALHKKQIEEFKEYKNNKRIKDELNEKRDAAATKMQAWWRGVMVRRQLGPFNPHKKKGKKSKNKKTIKNKKK